ncbi:hypothetical protein BT93_K0068 [Corymbia citriodora subsp. variegata]|nr:hypothetical protein BT93_K0068 [Corymbia citriodora subsp. variegata]
MLTALTRTITYFFFFKYTPFWIFRLAGFRCSLTGFPYFFLVNGGSYTVAPHAVLTRCGRVMIESCMSLGFWFCALFFDYNLWACNIFFPILLIISFEDLELRDFSAVYALLTHVCADPFETYA